MEPEIREMRDMLIEVRRDILHINQRLDDLALRHESRVSRLESVQQQIDERLRTLETKVYALSALISGFVTLLPYLIKTVTGGH